MTGLSLVDVLLSGPWGRRTVLEFAYYAARASAANTTGSPDSHTPGARLSQQYSPAECATELARLELVPVTHEALRFCLADSVASARYWQEPDALDALAATPECAPHWAQSQNNIAASGLVDWWT